MTNTLTRYGLLYGVAIGLGFYVSHLILGTSAENYSKGEIVGYGVLIISSIAIFFALKEYKEQHNDGELSFVTGLVLGTGVSIIGGLFFALYNWFYMRFINPTFIADYNQYTEDQIRSSGEPATVIEQQLQELAQYNELMNNGWFPLLLMFLTVFFIGVLFTLVTAAALKTEPPGSEGE